MTTTTARQSMSNARVLASIAHEYHHANPGMRAAFLRSAASTAMRAAREALIGDTTTPSTPSMYTPHAMARLCVRAARRYRRQARVLTSIHS